MNVHVTHYTCSLGLSLSDSNELPNNLIFPSTIQFIHFTLLRSLYPFTITTAIAKATTIAQTIKENKSELFQIHGSMQKQLTMIFVSFSLINN